MRPAEPPPTRPLLLKCALGCGKVQPCSGSAARMNDGRMPFWYCFRAKIRIGILNLCFCQYRQLLQIFQRANVLGHNTELPKESTIVWDTRGTVPDKIAK